MIALRVTNQLPIHAFEIPPWPIGTLLDLAGQSSIVSLRYDTLWAVVHDIILSLYDHRTKHFVNINNQGSSVRSFALPSGNSNENTIVRLLNYYFRGMTAIWLQRFHIGRDPLDALFPYTDGTVQTSMIEKAIHYFLTHNLNDSLSNETKVVQASELRTKLDKFLLNADNNLGRSWETGRLAFDAIPQA